MTRSIHEGFLLGSKLVGSETTWDNPSEPSGVVSPLGYLGVSIKVSCKKDCKRILCFDFCI